MITKADGVEFKIDVVGEISGEQYKGKFKALPRLTHRMKLQRDQRRRELLGTQSGQPDVQAQVYATVIAELGVRLVEWPKWWPETGFGLDLEDESPLIEINAKIAEIVAAAEKKLIDEGKIAEEALREKVKAAGPDDGEDE